MRVYLYYKKTFADDPESNQEGRIYNGQQLKNIFGGTIFSLLGDFFNHPYSLKFSYSPDDLTKYEISGEQEIVKPIVYEAECINEIDLPF